MECPAGTIVGAVLGTFFGTLCLSAAIAALVAYCLIKRRRQRLAPTSDASQSQENQEKQHEVNEETLEVVVCERHSGNVEFSVLENKDGGICVKEPLNLSEFVQRGDRLLSITLSLEDATIDSALNILGQISNYPFKIRFSRMLQAAEVDSSSQGQTPRHTIPLPFLGQSELSKCSKLPDCFLSSPTRNESKGMQGNSLQCTTRACNSQLDNDDIQSLKAKNRFNGKCCFESSVANNRQETNAKESNLRVEGYVCNVDSPAVLGGTNFLESSKESDLVVTSSADNFIENNDSSSPAQLSEHSTVVTVDEVEGNAILPFGEEYSFSSEWHEPRVDEEKLRKERASKGGMSFYVNLQENPI